MVDHVRHDTRNDAAEHLRDVRSDYVERMYDGPGRAHWGAIFAGAVVALGVFVLLALAGIGLGLSMFEPTERSPMNGSLTTTAIWQFVSQLVALFVGGYTAGRLAGVLHPMGSMLHGATVWALTTLTAVYLASQAVMGIAGMAGSAISNVAGGVTSAAQAVIPDDLSLPDLSLSDVSLEDLPEPVQNALREAGITPGNFRTEAQEAFNSIVSQREQSVITDQATQTAQAIVRNPADAIAEAEEFIGRIFGNGGVLGDEDRQEALRVMQSQFGLTAEEAEQFIQTMQERAETLQADAQAALDEARTEATQAADAAADAAAKAAWLAALASAIGLGAAVIGAAAGRPARA